MNLAQQPQQQFGMQVLAELVDDRDVLGSSTEVRLRHHLAPFQRRLDGRNVERIRAGLMGVERSAANWPVSHANSDAPTSPRRRQ